MKRLITIASVLASVVLASSFTLEATSAHYSFENPQSAIKEKVKGRVALPSQEPVNMRLPAAETPETYGEKTVVVRETFSKLTMGTEEKPDFNTRIYLDSDETPISEYPVWFNMKREYAENGEIWGAGNVYSAGGTLYMAEREAKINTHLIDLSKEQGNFFVKIRARASRPLQDGEGAMLTVEAAETFNMSPTWRIGEPIHVTNLSTEWKDYYFLFQGAGNSMIVNIVKRAQNEDYGVFIDEIEISIVKPFVAMPIIREPLNYKGASVDIRWLKVKDADGYLLSVYRLKPSGEPAPRPGMPQPTRREYVVKERKISGGDTQVYNLSGLTSGGIYFYTLAATKGDKKSVPAPYKELDELEAPVVNPIKGPAVDGAFNVSWAKVPSATAYNVWAYYDRTAQQDGEFVITDEDFANVRNEKGELSEFTPENPDPEARVFSMTGRAVETVQAGWLGYNHAAYKGMICLDGWHYFNSNQIVSLQSEEMDLSKDEGKFKVKVDLWGAIGQTKDNDGKVIDSRQTEAAIALFTYDEEIGLFKQVELVYPEKVSPKWTTYELPFTKGAKRSKLGIFAVKGYDNLYVDNLKITQNYKRGEVFRDACYLKQLVDGLEHDVKIVGPAAKLVTPIHVRVVAVRGKDPENQFAQAKFKKSQYSDYVTVQNKVGTEVLHRLVQADVYAAEGTLYIKNPMKAKVTIFNMSGATLLVDDSGNSDITMTGLASEAYVVIVGNEAFKVAL